FAGQPQPALPAAAKAATRRQVAENRAKVIEMVQATPHQFVAQERVKLSRAPAWVDDHLAARSIVVRTYVANGRHSVAVLPGGLTRVSKNPRDLVGSMQTGAGSKDTWILSNGTVSTEETAQFTLESRLAEHVPSGIPSRAADHLFWLGRYAERLEQLLRVLGCVLGRVSGETAGSLDQE